jgi:maleylacetate reductase
MQAFTYNALPGRIVFGSGSLARLPEEVKALGLVRVLVLSTPDQRAMAEAVHKQLGDLSAGVYDRAVMHVPVETVRAAVEHVRSLQADGSIAIGGGSTIGLGKAIALETGLPVIAIPTTYSGSEMTPIWGMTEAGAKKTGRDARVLPRVVIYDPELTLSLPAKLSATSGMNAIAHCVEALYAQDANPVISLMAEEGIRALAQGLPELVKDPRNIEARSNALYGSWLAGTSLGAVGMALHHKLCHTLGGSFNLPHAEVHTVVIPHATAYNASAAPEAMAAIQRALGVKDAAGGLFDLIRALGAPVSLKEIGMRVEDLGKAAEIATHNPYYNPRAVTREGICSLLQAAYEGRRPT